MNKQSDNHPQPSYERHIQSVVKDFIAALPDLKAERDRVLAKLGELNNKIQAAEMLVKAFVRPGFIVGDEPQPLPQLPPSTDRAPRRLVYAHVEQVLASGQGYSAVDLRNEINERFKIHYSVASIYRALRKGNADGKYASRDGTWGLKRPKLISKVHQ